MAKRTIRRRLRKNRTIRKVMRGCNRKRVRVGGQPAKVEAAQYAGASPQANQNLAGGTKALLDAQQDAGNLPPAAPAPMKSNMVGAGVSVTTKSAQQGGARTRHHKRKLRYKKSIARKSRRA
jgi:hypothetical protein